jgi:hypothetical protein
MPDAPVHAPPPSPPPDPPLIMRMANGAYVAYPMNMADLWGVGINAAGGWDDSQQVNSALLQSAGPGFSQAYLNNGIFPANQTGGKVELLPNAIYSTQNPVIVPPGCELHMSRGTIIAYSGSGPAVICQGNQTGGSGNQGIGTRVFGGVIDGTAVGSSVLANGIEVGGQYEIVLEDVTCQNFTSGTAGAGVGSKYPVGSGGINVANTQTLTEKLIIRNCTVSNCGSPNLAALSGSNTPGTLGGFALQWVKPTGGATSGSKMYAQISLQLAQQPGQNGIVVAQDAQAYYGNMVLRGNLFRPISGPNTCAAFVVGVGTGAGVQGHISLYHFDVAIESTVAGGGGGGTNPIDIWYGPNADNGIFNSSGRIRFGSGAFTNTNLSTSVGAFQFSGHLTSGDSVLNNPILPAVAPASGTTYTNGSIDSIVVFTGTVTANSIILNGVALTGTGAGDPVLVPSNSTIQVSGSGLGWVWASALAG